MTTKNDMVIKAHAFLEVVSREAQAKLGENLTIVQEAIWWSVADPNQGPVRVLSSGTSSLLQSGGHVREVFNLSGVSMVYQTGLMNDGFPEQSALQEAITAAEILPSRIHYGYLLPLVVAWCSLPDPLDLTQPATMDLLDEFAEAVIDRTGVTKYRDFILGIDLSGTPIELEEGISIRPIGEEELWEFGGGSVPTPDFSIQLSPTENWSVLDISCNLLQDERGQVAATIYGIREAIIANMSFCFDGGFTLLPLGMESRFGQNAIGRTLSVSRMPREFGRFQQTATAIDTVVRQKFQEMWPSVRQKMQDPSHYLNLPLRRLVDGRTRTRLDDKIIDYTIGLESLLSEPQKERTEIRYKFALRGAMILAQAGEEKRKAFKEFQALYDVRSAIAHGRSTSVLELRTNSEIGEKFLRKVWEWHLAQGLTRPGAISRLTNLILE